MLYPLSYESGSTGPIEHSGVYGTPHPTPMHASAGCDLPGARRSPLPGRPARRGHHRHSTCVTDHNYDEVHHPDQRKPDTL